MTYVTVYFDVPVNSFQ